MAGIHNIFGNLMRRIQGGIERYGVISSEAAFAIVDNQRGIAKNFVKSSPDRKAGHD